MHTHRLRVIELLAVATIATAAGAAEPGFTEDFNDGNTAGFISFAVLDNISTGGVGGDEDGYLRTTRPVPERLGAHSAQPSFTGQLLAEGVTGYSFWLNDVGDDEDLEIHVGVGRMFINFWMCLDGFEPPENEWQHFHVDITDSSCWVQLQGVGSFEEAVAMTDRLLFRHDLLPIEQEPDLIEGDYGVDRITVLGLPGDCDNDADVDLLDYECLLDCVTAPGEAAAPGCAVLDFDFDGDVDLHDFGGFQIAFTTQ